MLYHWATSAYEIVKLVRVKGLEPIRYNRQILSLVRLPIPPHPQGIKKQMRYPRFERGTPWLKVRCSADWANSAQAIFMWRFVPATVIYNTACPDKSQAKFSKKSKDFLLWAKWHNQWWCRRCFSGKNIMQAVLWRVCNLSSPCPGYCANNRYVTFHDHCIVDGWAIRPVISFLWWAVSDRYPQFGAKMFHVKHFML